MAASFHSTPASSIGPPAYIETVSISNERCLPRPAARWSIMADLWRRSAHERKITSLSSRRRRLQATRRTLVGADNTRWHPITDKRHIKIKLTRCMWTQYVLRSCIPKGPGPLRFWAGRPIIFRPCQLPWTHTSSTRTRDPAGATGFSRGGLWNPGRRWGSLKPNPHGWSQNSYDARTTSKSAGRLASGPGP